MKSPDYTVRDLVFYGGLFGGIIATVQFMQQQFQTHHLVNLLCGGAVGYVLGGLLVRMFDSMNHPPGDDPFRDDRFRDDEDR